VRWSLVVALSLVVGVGVVGAQSTSGPAPQPYVLAGVVRGVSAASVTLELADREIVVIGADSSTRVIGKGIAGDRVTVSCRRSGRQLLAVKIRVVRPPVT